MRSRKFAGYSAHFNEISLVISEDDGTQGYIMNFFFKGIPVGTLPINTLETVKRMIWALINSFKQLEMYDGTMMTKKELKQFLKDEIKNI